MSGLSDLAEQIDKMVKEVSEYLKQKDLAEFKSNPAFLSEITIGMYIFSDNSLSLDFIKDIEAIIEKNGLEVAGINIYPLNGISAVFIHVA
ncbi:MAG: hypothetical protein JHC38_08815, partial [Thiotrichales bacterium]|nr:hypothetical protein [Thiotrichales bacterium]